MNYYDRFRKAEAVFKNEMNKKRDTELFCLARDFVRETNVARISSLQRTFKLGYNEASRLMGVLEEKFIVSACGPDGSRIVLEAK